MIKRLMPLLLVTMCALPMAASAQVSTGALAAAGDTQVRVADATATDVIALTAADREALQLAQISSDAQLGDLRGGNAGLLVVLLLIILIIVIVD
jgi:hypothetical protein